jgi:hypothetical protein
VAGKLVECSITTEWQAKNPVKIVGTAAEAKASRVIEA